MKKEREIKVLLENDVRDGFLPQKIQSSRFAQRPRKSLKYSLSSFFRKIFSAVNLMLFKINYEKLGHPR